MCAVYGHGLGRSIHSGKVWEGAENRKGDSMKGCQFRSLTIVTRGVRIAAADVPRQRIIKRIDLQSEDPTH